MLALVLLGSEGFQGNLPSRVARGGAPVMAGETLTDLKQLAVSLNPAVGYWDPLKLAEEEFYPEIFGASGETTVRWLRHAEIKHGRAAMAGFVGYLVHEFGLGEMSAPDRWDSCPTQLKLAVILSVGALEWQTEVQKPHYLDPSGAPGASVPLGKQLFGKKNDEKRNKSKLAEINNGRLAMVGLSACASRNPLARGLPSLTRPPARARATPRSGPDRLRQGLHRARPGYAAAQELRGRGDGPVCGFGCGPPARRRYASAARRPHLELSEGLHFWRPRTREMCGDSLFCAMDRTTRRVAWLV